MVRQAPVICVMAPPIHLGAWSMVTITILIVSGSSCSHNCLSEAISAHLSYSYLVSLMREKLTGDNRLSGHPAMQFTCCINLVGHVCEPWTYLPPPPCIAPTTTGPLIGGVVSLVVFNSHHHPSDCLLYLPTEKESWQYYWRRLWEEGSR